MASASADPVRRALSIGCGVLDARLRGHDNGECFSRVALAGSDFKQPCIIARILCGAGYAVLLSTLPRGERSAGKRGALAIALHGRLGESRPRRALRGASLSLARRKRASRRSTSGVLRRLGRASEGASMARIVSQLLAAGPSARERSPGAARACALREHTRGRRSAPHEPAQPVRVPHGNGRTGL